MADATKTLFEGSLEIGQVRKTVGGGERNLIERPCQIVSLTHLSDVERSHCLAKSARRSPIGGLEAELSGPTEGLASATPKGTFGGKTVSLSDLRVLPLRSGQKGSLVAGLIRGGI